MAYSKRTWANGDIYNDDAVNDWEDRIEAGINAAGGGTPDDGSVTMAKFASGLVDTDNTLAADSDSKLATQKATKGYVTTQSGLLVPKSLIDAKGDLLVGTAADTVARKAVGSNGKLLVAASGESDGLKWGDTTDIGAVATRAYRATVLADSPSLYWPLDDTYGATDQSGNSRNGTGSGGITIGGYSGSPISGGTYSTDFDGSNDKITSSYTPMAASALLTFEGWANRDNAADYHHLFGDGGTSSGSCRIDTGSQQVQFTPVTGTHVWADAWPRNGSWVHWALVTDEANDASELFINGVSKGTRTAAWSWPSTTGLQIGMRAASDFPWNGKMAQFAVYPSLLTAGRIMLHYLVGVGMFA